MKKKHGLLSLIIAFSMIITLTNCKEEDNSTQTTIQSVTGYAQKGPFINGSSITVYDLRSNLSPTGKSFNAQITDNKGTFNLNDITLSSSVVSLRADGFYYNEVSGQQSAAQITLYALSDITDKRAININLMTHLEKSRVEYLIKSGKPFSESKAQAEKEILAIFNIQKDNIKASESLNIAESGADNGILLAVSSIIQGYRSESELTELLSNISEDISKDGVLDNETLGSALINHAIYLDTTSIKNNLTRRYSAIGSQSNIPDFGKYISNFIQKTKFKTTQSLIDYPAKGINGDNILHSTDTLFNSGIDNTYSLAASLPQSATLKIKITSLSSSVMNRSVQADSSNVGTPTNKAVWYYVLGSGVNWSISEFNFNSYIQTFTAIESGKSCDLKVFFDKGSFLIEYYEMNPNNPTRRKTITVK